MRVVISQEPFTSPQEGWFVTGRWPASWIALPGAASSDAGASAPSVSAPSVSAYRLPLTIPQRRTVRVHVSADQRYALFLNGKLLGRGPERGDVTFWPYETYDLDLDAGPHTLSALVWWLGDIAPMAQMTWKPGFLLAAEGEDPRDFNTGHAAWQGKPLPAYQPIPHAGTLGDYNSFTGPGFIVDGEAMDWEMETSNSGWATPVLLLPGHNQSQAYDWIYGWTLTKATLPAMLAVRRQIGRARHVDSLAAVTASDGVPEERIVSADAHLESEAASWNALLSGSAPLTVPAHTRRRVIVDLDDYYCAYPELTLSGGAGASVRLLWAEALYVPGNYPNKANRDAVDGKQFFGFGDTFLPDGGANRRFQPLWWRAGRYVELSVVTGDEPLTLDALVFEETRYPFDVTGEWESSDPRLADVARLAVRAIETGSHETYADCPYYEQMMYVGDSRIEALTTYVMAADDRLPRRTLTLFDQSRRASGLTASRYPSRHGQTIPPYSLFWVAMIHDFALWRGDPAFVRSLLPGVRAVLEAYLGCLNQEGLVQAPPGWNFMDWVPAWHIGIPPDGQEGVSAVLNWQFVLVLTLAAELEQWFGDPRLAVRLSETADSMIGPLMGAFYDPARGLIADGRSHTQWSEHAQCLALLSGRLPTDAAAQIGEALCRDPHLERATIYFSHYLFEAYRSLRRIDLLFDRLALWFTLKDLGLKTTIEQPEPSRSDNHGWGAHPLYHFHATLLGVRPSAPGFSEVVIDPQLGPLTWAKGAMPHPRGQIEVSLTAAGGTLAGSVRLPDGVTGRLHTGGAVTTLHSGMQTF